jgi:Dyp-type peroxidase family
VLQEGIYWHCSGCTPASFAVLFLDGARGAPLTKVADAMDQLWRMYGDLKRGMVHSLPRTKVPDGRLQVLVGYGHRLLARSPSPGALPSRLRDGRFLNPDEAARAVSHGAGLRYASDVNRNPADADIVVQLTADTELAVNRGVVETWRCLRRLGPQPALGLRAFFTGFQRDDRRSWIDFHDGVANLPMDERRGAIEIADLEAPWTDGGTYMAYLRTAIDLRPWDALSEADQELLVGRDKASGAALLPTADGGVTRQQLAPGTSEIVEPANKEAREVFKVPAGTRLGGSHVQRTGRQRTHRRIFRQGYSFLEPVGQPPYFRAGLNFVSFQGTPAVVHDMLTLRDWLGGTGFGGNPDDQTKLERFLTIRAAGMFLVPPVEFPGLGRFAG